MMAFHQKKLWLLPFLALLLLAADALLLGRDGAIHVSGAGEPFPAFRTETPDGHAVTDEIFAGKTTAICVWVIRDEAGGRAALQHLAALAEELPKNAQCIGLVGDLKTEDGPEKRVAAKTLAAGLPPSFPQLLVNDDFMPFLTRLRSAPTVVFIDGAGRLVGQPVVGDEPDLVRKEFFRLMEKDSPRSLALQKIQKALF
ncbi:MAG: hypothetical protein K5982_06990 [Selenomonadaceae bacterium]|nr:hypothetical protein [Selenomonadaceae bacterium]